MSDIKYEFFMSQIRSVRDIKENERTKLSLVFYEGIQSVCILRICKNRDLSSVYWKLMEIKNPNIVVVYDYIYANNNTYILLEYINGKTLEELLDENGVFSEEDTARIIIDVCKGLEVLHKCQPIIVHNDINTSNIMIRDDGSVKVFDFDISRTYKSGAGKNTELFGTEEYASPEHYGYGQSEPRTDIYSLGVTMHKMLSGKSLDSEHKMLYTGKLKSIINKCIQIDPKKRYSSVAKLQKDLEKFLDKKKIVLKILVLLSVIVVGVGMIWGVKGEFRNTINNSSVRENVNENNNSDASENVNDTNNSNVDENDNEINDKNEMKNNDIEDEAEKDTSDLKGSKEYEVVEKNTDKNAQSTKDEDNEPKTENIKETQILGQLSENGVQNNKKMNILYDNSTQIYSVVVLNDNTYVWLEEGEVDYCIKDSKGNEVTIKEVRESSCCKLAYDNYSDKLYLFQIRHMKPETTIYEVNKDYSVKELVTKGNGKVDGGNMWDELKVHFFSDKIMYCDYLEYEFADSNAWSDVGKIDTIINAIIDDRMFIMKWNREIFKYSIAEIDFSGNVIKEYPIPENDNSSSINVENSYCDNKYMYFVMSVSDKEYVYRFDGEKCEIFDCLNDYKYYTSDSVGKLCVTKDSILMLDTLEGVIREFK